MNSLFGGGGARMVDVPESVRPLFVAAGWFPGRVATVRFDRVESLRPYPQAADLVRAFGGLRVGACGPGRDCATSDIEFTSRPSVDDREAVAELEAPGDDLFPLGGACRGHMELFLGPRGQLFAYGIPDGSLRVVGESFGVGVERLLLGHSWPEEEAAELGAAADPRRQSGSGGRRSKGDSS